MRIEDVDVTRWKYVCPFHWTIRTPVGEKHIARGFLSDGASYVFDLSPEAFFFHDAAYLDPTIGGLRRGKIVIDMVYGVILARHWQVISAAVRPIGLGIFGWGTWRQYRRLERDPAAWAELMRSRFLPDATHWLLPGFSTYVARYIGDQPDL